MNETTPCPVCKSEYTYAMDNLMICPECGHEWSAISAAQNGEEEATKIIRDANGTELKDGDSVTVIKDLKVKGSSLIVKVDTKVKNIRLVAGQGNDGHDIDCKIPGIGPMGLKSEFVKKIAE